MKITIKTSSPKSVDRVEARELYDRLERGTETICPETRWLHPTARLEGLKALVRKGDNITLVTWDELTFDLVLTASELGRAEVEVHYLDDEDDYQVIKCENGALERWPDPNGFFKERSRLLSGDPFES